MICSTLTWFNRTIELHEVPHPSPSSETAGLLGVGFISQRIISSGWLNLIQSYPKLRLIISFAIRGVIPFRSHQPTDRIEKQQLSQHCKCLPSSGKIKKVFIFPESSPVASWSRRKQIHQGADDKDLPIGHLPATTNLGAKREIIGMVQGEGWFQ